MSECEDMLRASENNIETNRDREELDENPEYCENIEVFCGTDKLNTAAAENLTDSNELPDDVETFEVNEESKTEFCGTDRLNASVESNNSLEENNDVEIML